MKKIMIVSSSFTGHGHKSIVESLVEKLEQYNGLEIEIVEGFELFSPISSGTGKLYGPITRRAKSLWKLSWETTGKSYKSITQIVKKMLYKRLLHRLENNPPDLIMTVHAMFNGTVLDVLKQHDIKIPFITLIADLVDIHPMWVDRRADHILCPTDESMDACMMLGAPRAILRRCGLPVRGRFVEAAEKNERRRYTPERPLECLLMSGGEGSGNLKVISRLLLDNVNANIVVICGRNMNLKKKLEKYLAKYGDRAKVLGFTVNVEDYMNAADIALMRGSPNSMLEAITCNVPLIITGSLPGQEARNPEYIYMRGLGVACRDISQIVPLVKGLLENNAEGLNLIAQRQRSFRDLRSASDVAEFLYRTVNKKETE